MKVSVQKLTTDLGPDCEDVIILWEEMSKFMESGIMGLKSLLDTESISSVLWLLQTALGAMTETVERIPILERILIIVNASDNGVPLTKSEEAFVFDPPFIAELSTYEWVQHCVSLHNAADDALSDRLDALTSSFPQPRRLLVVADHLKGSVEVLARLGMNSRAMLKSVNLVILCVGRIPKADSLVQGVLHCGSVNLEDYNTYSQLMDDLTNQGTTAQAIYASYGHANRSVSFLRDLQSKAFVEVLRHGKPGGDGINPLGNKDFMTWAPLLQREVTGADLSVILSNIAALDAMH